MKEWYFVEKGFKVLRVRDGKAIVMKYGYDSDEFGNLFGKMKVFFSVADYENGVEGRLHDCFESFSAAEKCLFSL